MKGQLVLLLLLAAAVAHEHTFHCIFDKNNRDVREQAKRQPQPQFIIPPGTGTPHHGRLLTPSTAFYGPMRISLNTLPLSGSSPITPGQNGASTTTQTRLNFILQTLLVTQNFYQTRLQAAQLASITIPSYCFDFAPSNSGSQVSNTELYIFAQYITDKDETYGATGKACLYVTGTGVDNTLQVGRPIVGRIIFNTYRLVDTAPSLTNRLFQSVTATTIHEVTHILGFDATLYSTYLDVLTGQPYAYPIRIDNSADVHIDRPDTSFLTTPNVKAWARAHYGCNTLPGMPLENEDGTGAGAGSHWQRTAIYDDLMTATSFGAAKGYTGITFALLKDTGWYLADDTFSQTTNFGYNKGCSFVYDACFSATSFSEFCDVAASNNISYCQSTFYGKGVCTDQASIMSDECGIFGSYFNCVDSASSDPGYQPYTFQVYGPGSFCVTSTLATVTIPNMQSRCYPYTCSTTGILFTIGSYYITCLIGQQGVVKTLSALTGSLTCPNYEAFCTVSRKTCPTWCNQKGFCMNGICNCMPNSFNADCSSSACTTGQFYNPADGTCSSSCPSGTYQNTFSHTCQACKAPCSQCANTPTNCVGCISSSNLKYFYGGVCYATCPNVTFTSGFSCEVCDASVNCKTCKDTATTCTSCLGALYLDLTSCTGTCPSQRATIDLVHKQCVASCPSYLLTTGGTCVYCSNGTYLFNSVCAANCSGGGGASTYYPDDNYHACMLCNTACNTCDGPFPENCTSCISASTAPYLLLKMCWAICPKGFYPNPVSGKCQVCPVQLKCQACKYNVANSTPYCTSCIYGTFFFGTNNSCLTSCNLNQYKNTWNNSCNDCDSSCNTCNGPSSFSCLSCPGVIFLLTNSTGGYCMATCPTTGYIGIGVVCQPCDSTCVTCNGVAASQCSTCQSGYYYYGGYCRFICPAGTYPDSATQTCLPCDLTCSYCFNSTSSSCTSCVTGKYLYNFTCINSCPNGLTPNQWNVCSEMFVKVALLVVLGLVMLML